jgi:hypothetical protein
MLCTHGQNSPVDITGPVSTDAYPMFMVYDPSDLDAVRTGAKVDYKIDPVHFINATSSYGIATAALKEVGTSRSIGGAYFRCQHAQALHRGAAGGPDDWLLNPLVHVFHIAVITAHNSAR